MINKYLYNVFGIYSTLTVQKYYIKQNMHTQQWHNIEFLHILYLKKETHLD